MNNMIRALSENGGVVDSVKSWFDGFVEYIGL